MPVNLYRLRHVSSFVTTNLLRFITHFRVLSKGLVKNRIANIHEISHESDQK